MRTPSPSDASKKEISATSGGALIASSHEMVDELLSDAPSNWQLSRQVMNVAGSLRVAEGLQFERLCRPYLAFLLGSAHQASPQGSLDRSGIDFAKWEDVGESPSVAIQCKGFRVAQDEVGAVQIDQFLKSLNSLRKSEARPKNYILVHNRDLTSIADRTLLDAGIKKLVEDGIVGSAVIWDRKQMLRRVVNRLLTMAEDALSHSSRSWIERLGVLPSDNLVQNVPLTKGQITFRSNQAVASTEDPIEIANPAERMAAMHGNISFVLGGFGQGKTTSATQMALNRSRETVLLPAARLPLGSVNTDSLIAELDFYQAVVTSLKMADLDELEPLVRTAAERLLTQGARTPTLILDGLDEAPLAYSRGGIVTLLNTLGRLKCRTIITMRTEFWLAKEAEFRAGSLQPGDEVTASPLVSTLALKPWTPELMQKRIKSVLAISDRHARNLLALEESIAEPTEDASVTRLLERPLFLNMAIEVAETDDVVSANQAQLLLQWTSNKIERDVLSPFRLSSLGRPGIIAVDEELAETLARAHRIGREAAVLMLDRVDGQLVLTDSVSWLKLQGTSSVAAESTLARVSTQSLLSPTNGATQGVQRVGFAHRAIQEFYLAWAFTKGADVPFGAEQLIETWQDLMREDERFS
jgi:hypothetical protein